MKMVIKNPEVDPKEIDRAVSDLVTVNRQDDFRDISAWMVKTGLGEKGAREELINKISRSILREMGISLVQVTLHELEGEKEIKVKYEEKLQDICPHVDFIVKSGALDVWTTTYWFKVSSNVKLDNLAVTLKNDEITGIKSGMMQAFVTLAYYGHDIKNPNPLTLFKDKKVLDLDLAKVVTFE
jgi:hypothetical protein